MKDLSLIPGLGRSPVEGKGSVQFSLSVTSDSLQPHGLQHPRRPYPSPTPGSLPKLMSMESVLPSNHLILCSPLLLLPSIFPSIRIFSNESALHIRLPTPVFWPGEFHGLYSPWGRKESDATFTFTCCSVKSSIAPRKRLAAQVNKTSP